MNEFNNLNKNVRNFKGFNNKILINNFYRMKK